MLVFLSPIHLFAFWHSIIHGREQTFVFCLNNWLEAWREEGGKSILLGKKRTRKVGGTLLSYLVLSWQRWWLHIPFLASPLTHLLPVKVDLFPQVPFFPAFTLSGCTSYFYQRFFSFFPPDISWWSIQAQIRVRPSKQVLKKKMLNGRKTLNSGKEDTHTHISSAFSMNNQSYLVWSTSPHNFLNKIKTTSIHPGVTSTVTLSQLESAQIFSVFQIQVFDQWLIWAGSCICDVPTMKRVFAFFSPLPSSGVVCRGQCAQASRSIASNVLL